MYEVAKQKREACVEEIKTWDEFIVALNKKKLILAPWCDEEVRYKKNSSGKSTVRKNANI